MRVDRIGVGRFDGGVLYYCRLYRSCRFRRVVWFITVLIQDSPSCFPCYMVQRGPKFQRFLETESYKYCFVSKDCPEIYCLGKVTVLERECDRLLCRRKIDNIIE